MPKYVKESISEVKYIVCMTAEGTAFENRLDKCTHKLLVGN